MISMSDVDRLVSESQFEDPELPDWVVELYDIPDVAERVSCRLNYYVFLYKLARLLRPKVCLELGVEFGLASAHMFAAVSEFGGAVIGVDRNWHGIPGDILPSHGDYYYIVKDSIEAADAVGMLCGLHGSVGLVFQDSSHHYEESCREWDLYRPLMSDGGVWLCDDITPAFKLPEEPKGMVEYFQERSGVKRLYPDVLHRGNTMGVIIV